MMTLDRGIVERLVRDALSNQMDARTRKGAGSGAPKLVVNVSAQVSAEQLDAELAEAEAEAGIEHEAPEAEAAGEPTEPAEGEASSTQE